jgi:DNA-binding NarL/FixJ family response regulator
MHSATQSPRTVQNAPVQGMMKSLSPWRVLIVDQHAMVRQTIRAILESYSEIIEVVGEASDGQEAIVQTNLSRPDLVLMDVTMNGVDATRDMKETHPNIVVIGISQAYSPENYNAMIEAGAVAFVHKDEAAQLLFKTVVYAMSAYCPSPIHDPRRTQAGKRALQSTHA